MKARTRLNLRALLALLLAFSLAAAACGSDGESADGDETSADQTEDTAADDDAAAADDDAGAEDDAVADSGATGGTLTIAALVDNRTFDRAGLPIGHWVQYWMPVYDTLLVLAPDGAIEPNMATEWSWSDDKTVLTLTLRDDITFTDGTAFDADAVKANIEYLRDGGGQFANMAMFIDDVVAVDATTVEVQLSQPDPAIEPRLGTVLGAMASPASFGAEDAATNPIGSGAYVLNQSVTTAGTEYVYDRNPDYFNPDAYPYDQIVIKPFNDAQARLNALLSGEADTAVLGVASNIGAAEDGGLRIDLSPVDWRGLIIADRAGDVVPALGDVRVRQAINMAFDKQAIVDNVELGVGAPTSQIFPATNDAYDADLEGYYTYDVEGAKALMAEAGYADGFEVTMPEATGFAQVNPVVAAQLAQIGITVNYEPIAPDAYVPALLAGEFPMYWFSLGSQTAAEDFAKVLAPDGPWNTSKYEDPEVVAMIDAFALASGDEQVQLAKDINRYVTENAWNAPVYFVDTIIASNPSVGLTQHSQYVAPFPRDYFVAG